MISRLNHVSVFVLDQDRAKALYTETLGFELRNDAILDGFRWLTVGPKEQKDLSILLAYPAPPMFSPEDAEAVRALVAEGSLGGGVFETADCQTTFEELSAKGVTFLQEPRTAIRDRSALPRRLRELVQPHPAQVARVVNLDPGSSARTFACCASRGAGLLSGLSA